MNKRRRTADDNSVRLRFFVWFDGENATVFCAAKCGYLGRARENRLEKCILSRINASWPKGYCKGKKKRVEYGRSEKRRDVKFMSKLNFLSMGLVLLTLMAALEIALAIAARRKPADKRTWRRERLYVRLAELVIAIGAALLPFGQKWRLTGLIVTLAALACIAGLFVLLSRKKAEGGVKKGRVIGSCVMSIFMIGFALVPAFVFTGYKGLPVSGGYAVNETSAILVDGSRTDPFEDDGSYREVPAHFYYPDAEGGEKFPLIVFSHGAFGYYQSNTSTYMELASNGYVVVSLDHPHHAFFTRDTDGKTVTADPEFMNAALTLNAETDSGEQFALYREWMALRTADMGFALDEVKAAAEAGAYGESWHVDEKEGAAVLEALGLADAGKIGLMGHSMGGAAAVELGRERDDIAAVADIDGTMLGEYTGVENGELTVRDEPYPVPVLEFNNWESYNDLEGYLAEGHVHPNAALIGSAAEGFTTTMRGSGHMDFTDLPLLSPFLGKLLGSGERDTAEVMTAVNSVLLGFFNTYLKGEGVFTVQDIY